MLVFFSLALAGSMEKELTNALEMGKGTSETDPYVSFSLHFGKEAPVVVTGRDYESYVFQVDDGVPKAIELYAGRGDEKHNISINIEQARYYRLNVEKRDGQWNYAFEFYY